MKLFRSRRHPGPLCPPLDEHGHHDSAVQFSMWHIAAWLPDGRVAEVMDLLAANGIEVYRAWPVRRPGESLGDASDRVQQQMASCETTVNAIPAPVQEAS